MLTLERASSRAWRVTSTRARMGPSMPRAAQLVGGLDTPGQLRGAVRAQDPVGNYACRVPEMVAVAKWVCTTIAYQLLTRRVVLPWAWRQLRPAGDALELGSWGAGWCVNPC